jgi:hypothetical protein
MMMDIFSAILIVLPLVAPIAFRYGVNPYHLGVIFLLNLEIGYLTPPVGLNLFISSFKFRRPVTEVVWAVLPFMGAMFVALAIVTVVPSVTTEPPPKPRGTLDGLVAVVKSSKQAVINVKEVTAPDGKVFKQAECGAIIDEFDRDKCLLLFTEVTECRQKADPAEAKECEDTAMKEYFGETDDGGSFEDDGDDEGGGGFEADGDDDEAADGDDDEAADGDATARPPTVTPGPRRPPTATRVRPCRPPRTPAPPRRERDRRRDGVASTQAPGPGRRAIARRARCRPSEPRSRPCARTSG